MYYYSLVYRVLIRSCIVGVYAASKAAVKSVYVWFVPRVTIIEFFLLFFFFLVALTESMAAEIHPFGIRVLVVCPGSFRTEGTPTLPVSDTNRPFPGMYSIPFHTTNKIPDYDSIRDASIAAYASIPGKEPGDPLKAVKTIVDIVKEKGVAEGKTWPWCLLLGNDAENDLNSRWKKVLFSVFSVDGTVLMRLKIFVA